MRRIWTKIMSLKPKMDEMANKLAAEVKQEQITYRWSQIRAANVFRKRVRKNVRKFWEEYNCHPAKAFMLPLFQIPLWVGLSFALRTLCGGWAHRSDQQSHKEFYHGGFAWFRDMTVPDRYKILPVLYGVFNLLLCELWVAGLAKRTTFTKVAVWGSRAASVILVPVAALVPAAIPFYWVASTMFGVFQFLLFLSPKTMRLLRISPPGAPSISPTPYRDLVQKLLRRPNVNNTKVFSSKVEIPTTFKQPPIHKKL